MRLRARGVNGWRNLFRRSAVERELDDELQAALAALEERYLAAGLSRAEARRAARIDPVEDAVRDVRVGARIELLLSDVKYAARALRKAPAFTSAAVLSLALGMGANTAVFTFINALLLK